MKAVTRPNYVIRNVHVVSIYTFAVYYSRLSLTKLQLYLQISVKIPKMTSQRCVQSEPRRSRQTDRRDHGNVRSSQMFCERDPEI